MGTLYFGGNLDMIGAMGQPLNAWSLLLSLPWLKFIPAIIPLLVALYEIWSDEQKRGWMKRIVLPLLSASAVLATCYIIYRDDLSSQESEARKGAQLDRMEGRLGSDEATRRYLETVGLLTRQLAADKTGNSVEKFFNSEAERRKLREEADQANAKVLNIHRLRMEPVRDYILAKFDSWITEVQKRGMTVMIDTQRIPTAIIGRRGGGSARQVVFENGDRVHVNLSAASIVDGSFQEPLQFEFWSFSNRDGVSSNLELLMSVVKEQEYSVVNIQPSRFAFKNYAGKLSNPIEEKQFIDALDSAIDEVMAFVVEEATNHK